MESTQQTIDIDNMDNSQAIFVIWQLLNKAQSKGVFSIDEAYVAKSAIKILKLELESTNLNKKNDD
tara:strand:+ start:1546 stop:1743 length:198 start_codon:yes stop_codon:yes gene_type:complete